MLPSVILLGLVIGFGVYFTYASATRASGPTYSRIATKHCLERKGFSVTPTRVPDEPGHRDLYVNGASAKQGEYPTLRFFIRRSEARDYAKGDSAPLLRRGNVVVSVEDPNGDAGSAPKVRALTDCLRTTAAKTG